MSDVNNYLQDVYKKCLDNWGENSQLLMLIEECSETIQSVSKLFRTHNEIEVHNAQNNFIAEIVDLWLMCEQAKYIITNKWNKHAVFTTHLDFKVQRLEGLLKSEQVIKDNR